MKKVIDFLKEAGMSDRQSELYVALVELGPTTVKQLADHTRMPRPTVHAGVADLIQQGMVYQTKKGARRQIVAEDPRRLEYLIDERITRSQQLKSELETVSNLINMIRAHENNENGIKLKYYEGEQAVLSFYRETLVGDENYSFINLDKLYEIYPDIQSFFLGSYKRNSKRRVWDIAVDSELSRRIVGKSEKRYDAKFISSPNLSLGFDIQIYDNKVAIIQLEKGNVGAIVIESETIYTIMKALHQIMWHSLKDALPPKAREKKSPSEA